MPIRNIIWDMGGTLIDTYPAVDRTFADVARAHDIDVPLDAIERSTRTTSIANTMTALSAEHSIDRAEFERAYAALKTAWRASPPPIMVGAEAVIAAVQAAGGKNIIVTHRDRESAQALLDATGLDIDGLICAPDGHARKPDASMHRLALEMFGIDPAETIAIGDREIDATAALGVGVRPLHFDATGALSVADQDAASQATTQVREISSLLEALEWIDRDSARVGMLASEPYLDSDPALLAERHRARRLAHQLDLLDPDDTDAATVLLQQLFGRLGNGTRIIPPFRCDYGPHIRFGAGSFVNFNCVFLDVAPITIGKRVLIGPGTQLLTAGHPLHVETRASGLEWGKPITIGDDVWLGGGVQVLGGVTIGAGTVVGSGSVVTKDLPAGVIAVGNPARVVRELPSEPDI